MIEKPYLVHWSDEFDSNTETVATLDEAQTEIDRWLALRRGEADDGWALDMTGCIAVIVERVVEEESEAPEWSSFDRHVDYHREKVPDLRDARITDLEAENAALKGRLRETCQILVESVGGLGPCNAEDAARRAIEVVDQLRAQLAAPLRLPSVEEVSARVHDAWMESKRRQGVTSRKSETGEELMVHYSDLSDSAKDLDRGTVRAVYEAIAKSR